MKWEILHIPGKPPSAFEQSTVDVLASTIEPKLANILVRKLNEIYPLEDLRHVKRVRRRPAEGNIELSVILCLSSGHDNHMESLSEDLLLLINVHQLKPFNAKVAKSAATSKEEWEEQCKLWPTSYHPPNNLDGVIGFSDVESQLIFNYMKDAIRLTKFSCLVGKLVNAAVIVDPLVREIIASATDETCQCPSSASNELLRPHNENYSAKCGSNKWHPLRHAALVAIEEAAARDRHLFPGSGSLNDFSHLNDWLKDPSNRAPAKRQKTNNPEDEDVLVNTEHGNGFPSESVRPYLCTGFDMYLVWEPCTMCAMGLVHQRFRRIFYAFPNPNAGALGSVYRLQGGRCLNHHYSVYRILLPETYWHL